MTDPHEHAHAHEHAHEDPSDAELGRAHDVLLQLASEVAERFGDREPTEEELHAFLRERLRSQGRSEQEIEEIMSEL